MLLYWQHCSDKLEIYFMQINDKYSYIRQMECQQD